MADGVRERPGGRRDGPEHGSEAVRRARDFPDVMTPAQAAVFLGKSRETVLRWCRQGVLPCRQTPGGYLLSQAALRHWLGEE